MTQIKQRRLRWFRRTVRRDTNIISKVALKWAPSDGKRQRRRPKETWGTLTTEFKITGKAWGEIESIAKDRGHWRSLITALCATRREEDK